MDKRIAIPSGLAIMVALAVVGMLSFIGIMGSDPAEASITTISQNLQGNADLGKLAEPFASPLKATADVTGVTNNAFNTPTIQQTPEDPGSTARYTIKFRTPTALAAGVDDIVFTLDSEFGVPNPLDRLQVSISADSVTGGGAANESVAPLGVTVDFVGTEGDEPEITITVGDMDTSDNSGGNGIDALANVTVIIRQAAGVSNPTEQGFDSWEIHTTQDTTKVKTSDEDAIVANKSKGPFTPAIIDFSSVGEGRGGSTTAVAKGFEGGTDVTFWRDTDADGVRDTGEIDLCNVRATSGDIATCDLTINNPPFVPGFGTDCTGAFSSNALTAASISACNYINAVDGENRTSSRRNQTDIDRQKISLDGSVTVSPAEGNPGDTVTVQVKDYTAGALTSVQLGGTAITTNSSGAAITTETVPASGELNFTIKIPDGVPTGKQTLFVVNAGTDKDTDIIVGAAGLIPTPSTVVANQRVSIIGTGFSEGGTATINKASDGSSVTIGGETIHTSKINDGSSVTIDNGGGFSTSIDLPVTTATSSEGARELKIVDSNGREGKVDLIFPEPAISISPEEGRVSTNVTVSGTGFAAKNNDGNSISIEVSYESTSGGTNTATATPDSGGNWQVTLQVPSDAAIPSTNTVKAEYDLFTANTTSTKSGTKAITTVTHRVPRAVINVDTLSGPPGTEVSVDAVGFKRFTPVVTLEVGGIDVTPSPKPSTDANGSASFSFLIPGTDTGVQTIELDVGGTTASVGFTVTDSSGFGDGVVTPIEDALAPLFEDDSLDRAFFFNNVTKEWNFFINEDAFSSANDLDEIPSGQPVWIKVTQDKSVELNSKTFDLTCVNPGTPEEDCWNLIVFP